METKKCKWCNEEKDIKYFCKYKTKIGTVLRRCTCNLCYRKKHAPWTKKPLGVNKYDNRFKWETATEHEKLEHLKLVFENNVIKKDGCWDWKGKLHRTGYAVINYEHKQMGAHRAAWMIYNGPIREDEWILHKCDNKKCTNYLEHLYIGSPSDNAVDRENRNRRPKLIGKFHPNAVLNERKVKNIKKLLKNGISISEIAKLYKCGHGTIDAINRGWTWKHVKI